MRKQPQNNIMKLSIIILNYNTESLLKNCLLSLKKVMSEVDFEIIVVDNNSSDQSVEVIENLKSQLNNLYLIQNKENLGFAKGNNRARSLVKGDYVLFLNTDTIVYKDTLQKTVEYLDNHKEVGALTCKLVLPNGKSDKDARRSFITPWIGLVHIFLKLDRLFPTSILFAKYWYGYLPEDQIHEVDAIQGAYFLTRKKILESVNWFDEDYFLDAEDIDLCWKINKKGYKIVYYPDVSILHYKGETKGKIESTSKKNIPIPERLKYRLSGVTSMEIFYKKRLWSKYPLILNIIVLTGINLLKMLRAIKTVVLG